MGQAHAQTQAETLHVLYSFILQKANYIYDKEIDKTGCFWYLP